METYARVCLAKSYGNFSECRGDIPLCEQLIFRIQSKTKKLIE